ncbi:hypothetical protein CEY02_03500 [Bacillus pumilus]|uniref:Uncharacterized protein n=1 Tax=Bacillus pumilus TaxID=1408 RepID=A0A2A5IZB1_BACPU|nr:hypothetical protein [Bacillus pumilus]PCK22670.1 hypothetical protein CEY02_03500 [Bacillus pumilus]
MTSKLSFATSSSSSILIKKVYQLFVFARNPALFISPLPQQVPSQSCLGNFFGGTMLFGTLLPFMAAAMKKKK